jgi:hypothetical protein
MIQRAGIQTRPQNGPFPDVNSIDKIIRDFKRQFFKNQLPVAPVCSVGGSDLSLRRLRAQMLGSLFFTVVLKGLYAPMESETDQMRSK